MNDEAARLSRRTALALLLTATVASVTPTKSAAAGAEPQPQASRAIIVTGAEPERYVLYNSSLNAFNDMDRARRPEFDNAMKGQNLQLGHDFQTAIAEQLTRMGYPARMQDIPHRDADEFLEPSEVATVDSDIVVDIVFEHVQYANTPFSRGLKPGVWFGVRAIDVRTQRYIFREKFTYDGHYSPLVSVNVEPDPKYDFKSEADLYANPALAAEGLRAAAPLIAEKAVALLVAKLKER